MFSFIVSTALYINKYTVPTLSPSQASLSHSQQLGVQYICFSCSYVRKNITFHGPMRNHVGMKPLYSARKPSLRTV